MKYLNLGCGHHYSRHPSWTNLDFIETGKGVIAHNLLSGVPFAENSFDLVYHSHVLEHMTKADGEKFLSECLRVLKPGGILRIAVPDLEQILRNYLRLLEAGLADPDDDKARKDYHWILLELFDQAARNRSGGEMAAYLSQDEIANEEFVFGRIGLEGRSIRRILLEHAEKGRKASRLRVRWKAFWRSIQSAVRGDSARHAKIGRFRLGGEVHQWMYDRYSLAGALQGLGGKDIVVRRASESYVEGWSDFGLDTVGGEVRKPDSLFMEAVKR
jgi:predicted SAM-dependent methyltransferase